MRPIAAAAALVFIVSACDQPRGITDEARPAPVLSASPNDVSAFIDIRAQLTPSIVRSLGSCKESGASKGRARFVTSKHIGVRSADESWFDVIVFRRNDGEVLGVEVMRGTSDGQRVEILLLPGEEYMTVQRGNQPSEKFARDGQLANQVLELGRIAATLECA